jgi:hypothetical protein
MTKPMPAIFFGHGNPMNAPLRNEVFALDPTKRRAPVWRKS